MKPINNIEYTWIDAVLSLMPNAKVFPAEIYAEAEWHEEETRDAPTQLEVDTELSRLIDLDISLRYREDREYPSLEDQADMQYHDLKNGTNTWEAAIDAIKSKYPKLI
jgi:hypothetical protein